MVDPQKQRKPTLPVPLNVFGGATINSTPTVTEKQGKKYFLDLLPDDRNNHALMLDALEEIVNHDNFEATILEGDDPNNPRFMIRAEGNHRAEVLLEEFVSRDIIPEDYELPVKITYVKNIFDLLGLPIFRTTGKPDAANLRTLVDFHFLMPSIFDELGLSIKHSDEDPDNFDLLRRMAKTLESRYDPNKKSDITTPQWAKRISWVDETKAYQELETIASYAMRYKPEIRHLLASAGNNFTSLVTSMFIESGTQLANDYKLITTISPTHETGQTELRIFFENHLKQQIILYALEPLNKVINSTRGVMSYESAAGFAYLLSAMYVNAKKDGVKLDELITILGGRSYGTSKSGAIVDVYTNKLSRYIPEPYKMRLTVHILDLSNRNNKAWKYISNPTSTHVNKIWRNKDTNDNDSCINFIESLNEVGLALYSELSDVITYEEFTQFNSYIEDLIWMDMGLNDYDVKGPKYTAAAIKLANTISNLVKESYDADIKRKKKKEALTQIINDLCSCKDLEQLLGIFGMQYHDGEVISIEAGVDSAVEKQHAKFTSQPSIDVHESEPDIAIEDITDNDWRSQSLLRSSAYDVNYGEIALDVNFALAGDIFFDYAVQNGAAVVVYSGHLVVIYNPTKNVSDEVWRTDGGRSFYLMEITDPVIFGFEIDASNNGNRPSSFLLKEQKEALTLMAYASSYYSIIQDRHNIFAYLGGLATKMAKSSQQRINRAMLRTMNLRNMDVESRLASLVVRTFDYGKGTVGVDPLILDNLAGDDRAGLQKFTIEFSDYMSPTDHHYYEVTDPIGLVTALERILNPKNKLIEA